MKVLWFPGNGVMYRNTNNYNGGGWTKSLAVEILDHRPDIEFGMVIPWDKEMHEKRGRIEFYGIPPIKFSIWRYSQRLSKRLLLMKSIVEDFNPDLIHVFGSEHIGGLVSEVTSVPVVLHIQGILSFCKEAWLPYNMSWEKFISLHPMRLARKIRLGKACRAELKIFNKCRYYMGRTEYDRRVVDILSPGSTYFYCGEMLRRNIYNSRFAWQYHDRVHKKIISVISGAVYKGGDVILRTARLLKEVIGIDFEWQVCGVKNFTMWEQLSGIKANDVNVKPWGGVNENQLIDIILDADVFVHPSYIDNSPNSVCEAQLLGIPIIACHVGGVGSLISSGVDGILIPANDIAMMSSYICQILTDINFASCLGDSGRLKALTRHNPETIVNDVISIYQKIIEKHGIEIYASE